MKLNSKIRLYFVAPWVRTGMGFLNKNFSTFLGAVLASSLLFVFSCSKDNGDTGEGEGEGQYTLTVSEPENGTLTSEPEGIDCGSDDDTCEAQFDKGTEITLTAAPDLGYGSGAWDDDCRGAPDLTKCVLTMDADKTVSKKFDSRPEVTLTVILPTGGKITSAEGIDCGDGSRKCLVSNIPNGLVMTLKAEVTAKDYTIGDWGGACEEEGLSKTCTLTMNDNKTVTKAFNLPGKKTLTITTEPEDGTITSSPSGINCGEGIEIILIISGCHFLFDHGEEVTLTAEPKVGYELGDWGGDDCSSSDATCTLTMDADKSVMKAFTIIQYTLTITPPTNGTITSNTGDIDCKRGSSSSTTCEADFNHGTNVILTAMPDVNHELGNWGLSCTGLGATCTVAMTRDKTVTKAFTAIQRTLTIATRPANGTITSSPSGINCGSGASETACSDTFDQGMSVTLRATPKTGYALGTWGGTDCSSEANAATCTLDMTTNKTGITKAFTLIQRTLTITRPMNGAITSNPSGINCGSGASETACSATFGHGTSVRLTATPKTNYEHGAWGGTDCVSQVNAATCTLTMDTNKTGITKAFTLIIQRTLTITKPMNGTITSSPSGINCGESNTTCEADFEDGTSVTLTAAPAMDYVTGAWGGDDCLGSGTTCTLTMDANKAVSKAFAAAGGALDTDGDGVADVADVDDDNDGLIEVRNLDMFDHIRHNLAGTSYKTSSSVAHNRDGAPKAETANCTTVTAGAYLCGYELTTDLDFAIAGSYAGDSVNDNWRPLDSSSHAAAAEDAVNAGFDGITDFAGTFDGNGHSISNLYSRGGGGHVGLFRSITGDATIRSLGLVDANLYARTSSSSSFDAIGTLVGKAPYDGTINRGGLIIASYAKGGSVNNFKGIAGGLVGDSGGTIIACYASVEVNGSAGADYNLGGLLGGGGNITASYATGNVNGNDGNDTYLGGLTGIGGNITASYATGNVDGGAGSEAGIGVLTGYDFGDPIVASYGFGSLLNGTANMNSLAGAPGSKTVNGLTVDNADDDATKNFWDDADSNTKGAWDFGTGSQPPALKYTDYDGADGVDYCALFPAGITCGTTLLPGQRP